MADSNSRDDIHDEEDDKPTVVLDLNALKAQAKEQQEELDEIATDLEFNATPDEAKNSTPGSAAGQRKRKRK